MRRLALLSPLLITLACDGAPEAPLSYARCTAPAACGISTRCEPIVATTTGAEASICTAPCVNDLECPGWAGRCVSPASVDGGAARCLHGCTEDNDCRVGTRCLPYPHVDGGSPGVCAPDLGARPCARDLDCAPFTMRCLVDDAGTGRRCSASR